MGAAEDAKFGFQTSRLRHLMPCQHQSCGIIVETRGIARRHRAVFFKGRAEFAEPLQSGGLRVFVRVKAPEIAFHLDLDGHDLIAEQPGLDGARRTGLVFRGKSILILARHAMFAGHIFRRHPICPVPPKMSMPVRRRPE